LPKSFLFFDHRKKIKKTRSKCSRKIIFLVKKKGSRMRKRKEEEEDDDNEKSVKKSRVKKGRVKLRLPNAEPTYARSQEFYTTPDALQSTLNTYGVAVIPSVLSAEECKDMEAGFWATLGTLTVTWETPISKDNSASWVGLLELFPMHSMLIQHYGIGHAEFVWALRQNPAILDIFSRLWKVPAEELLVSFDGVSIHMPPETTKRGWFNNTWYHTDQRFTDSSFQCVQSWVTARPVNDGDATLTVLVGSNNHHAEFARKFGHGKLTQDEMDWFIKEKKCEPVSISCPAGSLVLWDSRTMHAGQEAVKGRADPNFRMITYLCYTPRSRALPRDIKKKQEAFDNMRMTSHWPHKPLLFGKSPRTYGVDALATTPLAKPGNVGLVGKKLAGF
jgi:ectoine hydroxylase-related dioxygenase (phytanoyl-CoA dioxygenase family)